MKRITLPGTRLEVSELCLGTNQFGSALDDARAAEILDVFFSGGGNFLDTAHSYGDWIPDLPRAASERALGDLLKTRPRASFVLATKGCEFDYRAGDFALRVTPAHLAKDLDGSLANLQLETIDLYWLHRDDPAQPVSAILDALIAQQTAGRIRHFGCSNWTPARINESRAYAASIGHQGFIASQPMWGLAEPDRQYMAGFAPQGYYEDGHRALHAAGLTIIPYSGQSRGIYTKLDAGLAREQIAPDIATTYWNDATLRKLPALQRIAAAHGVNVNAIVLAYMTSQPMLTIPIIGCSSVDQLRESIAACAVHLDAAELDALRNA